MKHLKFVTVMLVAVIGIGANCVNPKTVRSALDVTQVACILVNDWADSESELAKLCDIADDYLPEVRKLVAARKKAAVMRASRSDAGAEAGHD